MEIWRWQKLQSPSWLYQAMKLKWPDCDGLDELPFAEAERSRLSRIVGDVEPTSAQFLATDALELHILHGFAVTAGSAYGHVPPSQSDCFELFCQVHDRRDNNVKAQLHVGGRAFTKHAHRASDGFWGISTGSNAAKNGLAEAVFERIWSNATWRNIFWLPHGIVAFEIRVKEGYGMRFQRPADQSAWTFRGFVEPSLPDGEGHAKKWRH